MNSSLTRLTRALCLLLATVVSVLLAGLSVPSPAWAAEVNVAGSGDVRVNARQRLRASLAGSGDVRHTGPARDVSHSSVGSGRLIRE